MNENKFLDTTKKNIGKRIKTLRKYLNIEQQELADATNISKGTINSIENGIGFTGDYIIAISFFFGMELSELVSTLPIPLELELKDKIRKFRKKHGLPSLTLLNKTPEIKIAIEHRLLRSNFFDTSRTIQEIIIRCAEDDFKYNSSSVSNVMKELVAEKKIERILSGKKNFLYRKI